MKAVAVLLAVVLAGTVCLADDYTTVTPDTVHWTAASGDWMTAANWSDEAGGSDWAIPGWVNGGAFDSNGGLAKIAGGVCNLTPASKPDGSVAGLYIGGAADAALNISGDLTVRGISYMGAGAGATSTVSQTAGNVVLTGAANFGEAGTSAYNLSGGTLTLGALSDFGSLSGGSCTLTQTNGSSMLTSSTLNFGDAAGSSGSYLISGTDTTFSGTEIRVGNYGSGYMSIANGASVTTSGYMHLALQAGGSGTVDLSGGSLTVNGAQLRIGSRGQGILNQSGGSLSVQRIYMGYASTATDNEYNLSGGSYYANRVTVVGYASGAASTWNVIGSDITSIRTAKLDMYRADATLAVYLDENGSTLIEAFGITANGDLDQGCVFADGSTLKIGTIAGFDGAAGDVYDILWSATGITLSGNLNFVCAGNVDFSYDIVDDAVRGGQLLQVTVVPEPAAMLLLAAGGLLLTRRGRG